MLLFYVDVVDDDDERMMVMVKHKGTARLA
jgi:hypothetical protein